MDWSSIYGNKLFMQSMFPEQEFGDYPMMGMSNSFNQMGSIWGGGFMGGAQNLEQYIDYQKRYRKAQDEMEDYSLERDTLRGRKKSIEEHKAQAPDMEISEKIEVLRKMVDGNRQSQVQDSLANLEHAIKAKYSELGEHMSDADAHTAALHLYKATAGVDLASATKDADSNPFWHGLTRNFLGLGRIFGHKETGYKNAAYIEGTSVSKSDNAWETAGNVVGLGLSALAVYAGCKHGGNWYRSASHSIGQTGKSYNISRLNSSIGSIEAKYAATGMKKKDISLQTQGLRDELKKLTDSYAKADIEYNTRRAQRYAGVPATGTA